MSGIHDRTLAQGGFSQYPIPAPREQFLRSSHTIEWHVIRPLRQAVVRVRPDGH